MPPGKDAWWIYPSRLPKVSEHVLVYYDDGDPDYAVDALIYTGKREPFNWDSGDGGGFGGVVLGWRPYPEPPDRE